MITGWPRCVEALSAMPRNRRSALTPAWNGTISVMGFVGKSSALATADTKKPASVAATPAAMGNKRCIADPSLFSRLVRRCLSLSRRVLSDLVVSLSNHGKVRAAVLRQAQDEVALADSFFSNVGIALG